MKNELVFTIVVTLNKNKHTAFYNTHTLFHARYQTKILLNYLREFSTYLLWIQIFQPNHIASHIITFIMIIMGIYRQLYMASLLFFEINSIDYNWTANDKMHV